MSAIDVTGLGKSYGDIAAVHELSFSVDGGEILAIVGPDGAGKTTALRSMCGLIRYDEGEIRIMGYDVAREFDSIKPLLGYMPQNFSLYQDLSVEENLRFYAGLFGVRGEELSRKREILYGFSGLEPFAGRRAGALSGGMKQKLALSCALVHDPSVLILDEPTTGVDPLSRRQFWDILHGLREKGAALIVTTPYMDEAELAGQVLFLHEGKKIAEGAPAALLDRFRSSVYIARVEPTVALVDRLNAIEGVTARRVGGAIHICLPEGRSVEEFSDRMEPLGVTSRAVEPSSPDLADVFIQMMREQ
jgi:ABC-2 type transport system ATP-binding protein